MNPRHVTAAFAVAYMHYVTEGRVTLNVNQIRVWAHRDKIKRAGKDPQGYALYDLTTIIKHATSGVSLDSESQPCNSESGDLYPNAGDPASAGTDRGHGPTDLGVEHD